MNGKNKRVKGCWSRGIGDYYKTLKNPLNRKEKQSYNLPTFSFPNDVVFSSIQIKLINTFKKFYHLNIEEDYVFNNNTNYACIILKQQHFNSGTVRITKPGIYILREDITFEPNPGNDFMPFSYQMGPNGQYPARAGGAYHLGFFAAITIETNGVILDLNGKKIQQSKLHNLQQRFYANIELGSAPFIPSQGPVAEGFSTEDNYNPGTNVLIKNGTLGLSSHHGIHGNLEGKSVIIKDLIVENFEVAGIALNGASHSILDNITIRNTNLDVKVLSAYSQARFIRPFLKNIDGITHNGKSGSEILSNLQIELDKAKNSVMSNTIPSLSLFGNQNASDGYDGNVYGLVLHVNGIVINDFFTSRPSSSIGNQYIYMQNIDISGIKSRPVEIIALTPQESSPGAYGGKRQVGPFGDVLDINFIKNSENKYTSTETKNIVSSAQLFIAKAKNAGKGTFGTTNITSPIVNWSETNTTLTSVMSNNNYYFVHGGDSMGHLMKGNIGLFVSAGENITGRNITISNVISKGAEVGLDIDGTPNSAKGGNSRGVIISGSSNINLNSPTISGIITENANSTAMNIETLSD